MISILIKNKKALKKSIKVYKKYIKSIEKSIKKYKKVYFPNLRNLKYIVIIYNASLFV